MHFPHIHDSYDKWVNCEVTKEAEPACFLLSASAARCIKLCRESFFFFCQILKLYVRLILFCRSHSHAQASFTQLCINRWRKDDCACSTTVLSAMLFNQLCLINIRTAVIAHDHYDSGCIKHPHLYLWTIMAVIFQALFNQWFICRAHNETYFAKCFAIQDLMKRLLMWQNDEIIIIASNLKLTITINHIKLYSSVTFLLTFHIHLIISEFTSQFFSIIPVYQYLCR